MRYFEGRSTVNARLPLPVSLRNEPGPYLALTSMSKFMKIPNSRRISNTQWTHSYLHTRVTMCTGRRDNHTVAGEKKKRKKRNNRLKISNKDYSQVNRLRVKCLNGIYTRGFES